MTYYLTVEQLQQWNAAHTEGGGRIRDHGVIEGALRRCEASAFGEDAYPSPTSKAAALVHALASTQGFENGNKRTAWFACEAFLELNGLPLRSEISEVVAEVFVQSVANSLIPLERVEEWLVEHLAITGEAEGGEDEPAVVSDTASVTGEDGELVRRFIDLLGSPADPLRVVNAEPFVEVAIGDRSRIAGVVVVPHGVEPAAGTVLAERVRVLRRVTPSEWLVLLRERLEEIVRFGVAEDFLVCALRDLVTARYEAFADVGRAAGARRRTREDMLAMCDDKPALERFQEQVAHHDPSVADLTLDEFADQVRGMAERLFRAPDADEAVNHWSALAAWRNDVAILLNDDIVSTWSQRRLFR